MSYNTIRQIHSDLKEQEATQESIVEALRKQQGKIVSEYNVNVGELLAAVKTLIPTGDKKIYAEMTKAAKQAGSAHDFSAMVQGWETQDAQNRAEYAALQTQWGDKKAVAAKLVEAQKTLEVTEQALEETALEVDEFDKTTKNIEAHNRLYPKHQITLESHDSFEKTGFWRRLGYYTFINRGPHAAYLALGTYTAENRDYYEYAREVEEMRDTRISLTAKLGEDKKAFEAVESASSSMDALNAAYKGSEVIAREVREMVSDFLLKDDDFAQILGDFMKNDAAQEAALAVAKMRALRQLENTLSGPIECADRTLADLREPLDDLSRALSDVGGESISYTADRVEREVSSTAKTSRTIVRMADEALQAIDNYKPQDNESFSGMVGALLLLATPQYPENRQSFDFGDLKSMVRSEVDAYEREQERLREIARRAEEARRAEREAREAFERAARARERRTSSPSFDFGRSSSPGFGGGISRGSSGIGRSSSFGGGSVSRGSSGMGSRSSSFGGGSVSRGSSGLRR